MELSKNFEPQHIDNKWYSHWLEKQYFNSTVDTTKEPYTIVIPPPNVTGVLHMGHCLNNTIQDILIRRARMMGKNACWVPGTDHASIATEAKVVQMLREKGITKSSLSRDEFLQYAWEWKEKYGGIILQQLKKLGCSLDWNRVNFTMNDDYYKSVINTFVQLYNDGIIYRGLRMVNWDPVSKTALSDEEVIFKEIDSKLYYVKYPFVENNHQYIMVATTRPETILGDVAICVNPSDERYKNLIGKEVIVPIINRKIPIIADEYVDATFGTGALKITPAHDKNDNELGRKHQLKAINTLNEDGKFIADELQEDNPSAQVLAYHGIDRFELRKKIVEDIAAINQIEKIEDYKGQIGTSERTGAVIESRLSMQWFMNMKKFLNKNPEALNAVMNDAIMFHPSKLKNTYKYWLENIKDWCISRQLWWGQRIPAWYDENGHCIVAATQEEAVELYKKSIVDSPQSTVKATNNGLSSMDYGLKQDEDVLDTWFSSWLWPIEVFKGISNPNNEEINYYYPTTTLVTGQDIIFFWVARMIMAGYEFKQQLPFKDVYFTGMVRDKQGRKMSKQLGNSPDLLALIDSYGADAVRFGIMIASPAGNDLLFDESSLEQGRNFNNKIWNVLKLMKMWEEKQTTNQKPQTTNNFPINWFENRLNEAKTEVDNLLKQFRLSEALKVIYSLIWDDFCSWYIEWIKPNFGEPIEKDVYEKTISFFEELMQLLHPYMPFITEEIYHQLKERKDDLTVKQQSTVHSPQSTVLQQGELLKKVITSLREARAKNQIKPKDVIKLHIQTTNETNYQSIENILKKQINAEAIYYVQEAVTNTIVVAIENEKFFIEAEKEIDSAALKITLEKDLQYQKGFLETILKKLSNERFVQNAKPEVIAIEQKKKADCEARIKTIEESLASLQ
ncbi:MAG: valine--tRNA ligase [Chitinophagaceae bacterium]|nr:valine--tRNA ligase [Chitinophagaceae bacterium]MCW5905270.1 valine--tRNA ligase [Chitinophagaceae bacterium]